MVAFAVTLREKLTSSETLRRDETTQSFKLGCVVATKLGALVPPPPLLELPSRDTESHRWKLVCFCLSLLL